MTQILRRPIFHSLLLARSGRRYSSIISGDDPEPESWKSREGLIRCSANYGPLSPIGFLERSSMAYRDNTSLIYGSLRYTWAQTHLRCLKLASSLAHHLRISRGDVVATFSYNLPEMYELHFAVPMAGAILCPLNARHDASMVSVLLGHSRAKVLFVDPQLLETARQSLYLLPDPPVLVLMGSDPGPDPSSSEFGYEGLVESGAEEGFEVRRPTSEWDPISINYTSGTTSRPKAVVYSHRGAYLNSLATVLLHNMGSEAVYLWTAPMFHCNGWGLVWGGAAQGASNVCLRKPTPEAVLDCIASHGVTHMGAVPTLLNSIVNLVSGGHSQLWPPLTRTVEVLTGGAPPLPHVLTRMEEMGFKVNHIYGMTETYGPATNCVAGSAWDGLPAEERLKKMTRQGLRHLGLEEVDVRDPVTMESVPADGKTIGEVVFRGNTIMIGYLGDEAATREAFRGGWLWSGDIAVKHPDHYIQVKDRAKDVVISGGENVSSVEVETAIYGHTAVLEAAVVGRPDKHWGETPCAFVTLKDGFEGRVKEQEIIEFCRTRLPRFMAPRTVVFGELPKTSTGKIQKYLLREKAKAMGSL